MPDLCFEGGPKTDNVPQDLCLKDRSDDILRHRTIPQSDSNAVVVPERVEVLWLGQGSKFEQIILIPAYTK